MVPVEEKFVYLAYLDDSDTKAKRVRWQVMTGVLMDGTNFKFAEVGVSQVRELLKTTGNLDKFEEFHACELYGGYGAFQGIDQKLRFDAINRLLAVIAVAEAKVVYGAVNIDDLQDEVFGSADPQDICFRICVKGIDEWTNTKIRGEDSAVIDDPSSATDEQWEAVTQRWLKEMVLVITDECSDKKLRDTLLRSYRSLRPPRRKGDPKKRLYHLHDDMYFGDSRYSVGIQLADLCSYFIARHLEGDEEVEHFYECIRPYIVYKNVYPPREEPLYSALGGQLSLEKQEDEPASQIRSPEDPEAEVSAGPHPSSPVLAS